MLSGARRSWAECFSRSLFVASLGPLKRMQRARVPSHARKSGSRPPRLATGKLHTGALKRGLGGGALHRRRAPRQIH